MDGPMLAHEKLVLGLSSFGSAEISSCCHYESNCESMHRNAANRLLLRTGRQKASAGAWRLKWLDLSDGSFAATQQVLDAAGARKPRFHCRSYWVQAAAP